MSSHLTSNEVRQDYIATMGDELGGQFNEARDERLRRLQAGLDSSSDFEPKPPI